MSERRPPDRRGVGRSLALASSLVACSAKHGDAPATPKNLSARTEAEAPAAAVGGGAEAGAGAVGEQVAAAPTGAASGAGGADAGAMALVNAGAAAASGDAAGAGADVRVGAGAVAADGTRGLPCEEPPVGMACVPAGPFIRGADDGPEHARPAATIWLQTYYMDLDEVTYAEYKACAKARKCPQSGPGYTDFDRPRQPINGISWHDAVAYCAAQGKRLPTEAQWEKAARGPDGDLHPWGDEPATCERAIIKDARGRGCGVKKQGSKPETGRPWEVGSLPPGHYGLRDMSGNSWEWVADWYSRSYAECGDACLGVDPKGPCGGAAECPGHRRKIVRGGSWYWDASYATAIWRRPHFPENRPFHHFGFRCAATAEDAAALRAAARG